MAHLGEPTETVVPDGPKASGSVLVQSLMAGPSVSDGNQPIHFYLKLNKPAKVSLYLFALTGEEVYSTVVQGNQGDNTLVWEAKNQSQQTVASGLYIYLLRAEDGSDQEIRHGKMAIIH